ncbi:MAG TPA: LPS export ABC transporter periplasmic protein LptC [Thermoanaerobaculia bacterium]|nr:LPS export ABC transporter periplasmic protein LptC [Thermoanaerobaculia bacterium]
MTRTVRVLRVALPIAFVAFVGLLVLSWNRSDTRRDNGDANPVTSTQRPEDKPQAEAIKFEDVQTIGGRVVSRIRATRVVGFESGWSTLEGVHLTIYRANGQTYELSCPQAQYNSETKEADVKGGVKLTSSDGIEVQTAEMHFDGTRLTNRIPVQFRVDRWRGNGGALDLDVPGETLKLFQNVTATMEPAQPAEPPLVITAAEALFRRNENDVTFSKDVVGTRAADRMSADRVIGRFTTDRKRLLGLEGHQAVEIIMAAAVNPGEDLGGRKRITGDRFFTEFTAAGDVLAINVVGESGPARALLDGPPRREVEASSFRVAVANRAVSEMKAAGQVVMVETEPARREVRVDTATISFDPVRHRASNGFFEGNFKYRDPKTQASSIRAHYDIANDQIVLTASPGFDPTVVSDGQTLKAKQIEFSPKSGVAKATGSVVAELVSKGGVSAESTNLFPAGKPVFVNSDLLVMRQVEKTAAFSGNVRAWQDMNTLFANELTVQGTGQTLTARGNVRTVLYNTGTEVRRVPLRSKSDQLLARRAERDVELSGSVTIEDESRTMSGEKATLYFDAQRKIERIEASEKVVLVEKTANRKGTGDKVIYQLKQKMAYLHGSPATATDPQGSLSGQQIVFDLGRNRVQVLSPTGETQGTFKQTQ